MEGINEMDHWLDSQILCAKNSKNEAHILAILLELESFVNNANGQFIQEWENMKSMRKGKLRIMVPNNALAGKVDRYLDDIDALIKEEKSGLTPIDVNDTENCSNLREKIGQLSGVDVDHNESTSESDSSDESWTPSEKRSDNEKNNSEIHLHEQIEETKAKKFKVDNKKEDLEPNRSQVRTSSQEETSSTERRKIPCPLVICKARVIHLPRHMRNVHHWTKEAASKVLSKYNIRSKKCKGAKTKDYHRRRRCPIAGCHSVVQRLSAHLQKVHDFPAGSKEYKDAMLNAPIAPDRKHGMIRWQEERLKTKLWELNVCTKQPEVVDEKHSGEKVMNDSREMTIINSEFDIDNDVGDDDYADEEQDDDDDSADEEQDENDALDNDEADKIQSNVMLPPLIVQFQEWLASPDGGKRDEKTVKQHGAQLFIMLKVIDKNEDIQSLLDLRLIRQVFLKSYVNEKKYEAGTIKSYLMSVRHFYSFLLSDKPDGISFNWVDVSALREKVKMWSASYKRDACTRKWQKLEEDMLNHLTPSNIRKFEKSTAAREAVKMLGQYSDETQTPHVTQSRFTLVRDFLFTQIFIDNANRPGVLAHMTIHEYNKIRKQDEHYVVTVKKHKTAYIHGPARVVLSEKLKSWLSIFVHVMRPQVTSASSGLVFVSWNGNGMTSGQITKAVQSVFKKSGLNIKVTSTSFRKAAVTTVHNDQPDMSGKLADLMAHNPATAKKYYLLTEKSKTSVEASKNLGRLMRRDNESEGCVTASKTEGETAVKEKVCSSEISKSADESGKLCWSEADVKKIQEAFEHEILHDALTLDIVRYRVETLEELRGMTPRKIYDKLKKDSKRKSTTLVSCPELPQELDTLQAKLDRLESDGGNETDTRTNDDALSASIIPSSERNSNFTQAQVNTLNNLFKDMICSSKTISRTEIEKRCSNNKDGQHLLEKMSVHALLNRIKYERRKYRKAI